MTASKHLIALLKSHIARDDDQFLSIAMQVAAHEARKGHGQVAQQLRALVDQARSGKVERARRPVPIAQPKGDLAALVSVSFSETRLASMALTDELELRLKRVLTEQRQQHKLVERGLQPRRKLLLVGPPGSGKTMTAGALAGELHLPLFTVVFDTLITRFMGETASKLRIIFDAMTETRGVYFFDEFDAIGSRRSERNDVGEIRRVLNSFLQFLEKDDSDSLIIAATNHVELLDPALFRRFDDVIQYGLPDEGVTLKILQSRLVGFEADKLDWGKAVELTAGLSQAEISRAADEAAKRAILADRSNVTDEDLSVSIQERGSAAHR
ncbi:ATP-binding protein (plasmid) [Nitratireductor rhodophyticola]|jgi:SpoVK/Ycf46/Vps4 family AAA+-type ATPase|uniref:ATP-binding protein n=1 Tax=Nitratireductor rhodophyticola TaxID=2854036 RepID=A0ABS7RFX0_9HYPH|nr:ATP-binding protein [Nitratireductor rhodophyticola]MBY8918861.1 ATP-binding protein [Nitratireductor rhodophyticola]MBY8923084.1 ATP-binding protein [Nitratireductor rhodophyticola]MEC9244423.1 ATP-binding protein [Pseudomonadota bacterium]WPZ16299.1 ATP-binding protein [Nitratireductor rhodophyticola]